jgi:hypothetical protein
MKYMLIVIAVLSLAGCEVENNTSAKTADSISSNSGRPYQIECIDGIEYWHRTFNSVGFLAVRIDPKTMTFVRCEVN